MASFVVQKFGTAKAHQLGSQGSAVTLSFEGIQLRDYGMIPTTIYIQENEDTSIQTSCGNMQYAYSTGAAAVAITVEGSLVSIQGGGGKDWSSFYKQYKVTTYKQALRIAVNKAVYYCLLLGCDATYTSTNSDDTGTFTLTFSGVAA